MNKIVGIDYAALQPRCTIQYLIGTNNSDRKRDEVLQSEGRELGKRLYGRKGSNLWIAPTATPSEGRNRRTNVWLRS